MRADRIHRDLVITSPEHIHGADVKALQRADNRQIKRLGLEELGIKPIPVDADFGHATLYTTARRFGVAYELGAPDVLIGEGKPITQDLQRLVRAPWAAYAKHPTWKARELRRRRQRKERRKTKVGPDAALKWAASQIGVREHPPNTNRGPEVSAYQRNFGADGSPWCGFFVGTAMMHGGLHPSSRIGYVPYIASDYPHVSYDHRQPGDLVCFNFGAGLQHVGMLDHDRVHTIEGNTSSGAGGSQDNGGTVARRQRDRSTMAAIVRPW